jgi:molybdopterin-binding protein
MGRDRTQAERPSKGPTDLPAWRRNTTEESPMKMSARNRFAGTVAEVKKGQVMAQITVDIGGHKIMSAIFTESADDLSLKKGDKVTAVIKSTDVIIFKD